MLDSIVNEFKRSPIAAISGVVGIVVGALTLVVAMAQFEASSLSPAPSLDLSGNHQSGVNVANLLLAIAFFLSSSFAGATIIRIIARKHDFAALFFSVPLAALINFLTILTIYLTPPREISVELFSSANDLVIYASVTVFLTICGKAVLRDIASPVKEKQNNDEKKREGETKKEDEESKDDALATLVIAIIILVIWTSLVFKGQSLLSETFLPEVTHPVEEVRSK